MKSLRRWKMSVLMPALIFAVAACGTTESQPPDQGAPSTTAVTAAAQTNESTTTSAPKDASAVSSTAKCERISFTPDVDFDVASQIHVTGVSCEEAHKVIRSIHDEQWKLPVTVEGFSCASTAERTGGPTTSVETVTCSRSEDKIIFDWR